MSSKTHNKKRNSILLYEFLVRTISRALVENDKKRSSLALKILKKHYKQGTELYKEFRIMNALVKTTVSSDHVAASILKEAKTAISSLDSEKLDREKSILIRNINHMINDEGFYDQHVSDYRTYATIQTLMNEWRSSDKDLIKMAEHEDHLMKRLVAEKAQEDEHIITEDSSGTARLVMKVMTKKLNEKYSEALNDQQKGLIKAYAFSAASDDNTSVRLKLKETKENLLSLIEDYSQDLQENNYLRNKLSEAKAALLSENLEAFDDSMVTRFMLYLKLKDELEAKE